MPNWVSLKDLMENPSKYGVEDPRLLEIAYTPDKQSITLTPDMTGYEKEQTFETETEGHQYYPVIHEGKLYVVSNKVTQKKVILRGNKGGAKGPEALKRHAKLWDNEVLGAKGETWNEETIRILDRLPKFLRKISRIYWTAIKVGRYLDCGLRRVNSSSFDSAILYYHEFSPTLKTTCCYSDTHRARMRPLVSLPFNIQVDIETLDDTPLRLRLP